MKYFGKYIKSYWYCFILGPMFMVLEALGEFILPYINANIINNGALSGDTSYIYQNGLLMGGMAIFMMITGVFGAYYSLSGAIHLATGIRQETFEKIQAFSFATVDEFSTGSLITRLTNDITQIQNFLTSLLRGFFRSPIMIIGALVMSYLLHPGLARILLIVVILLALSIFIIIKTALPRYAQMQTAIDGLNNDLKESITNERVIKSFVREDYEITRFNKVNTQLMDRSIHALKVMVLMQPISTLAINACTLFVVIIAGRDIIIGDMAIGTLTAFITYLSQVLTALGFLANIVLQGTRASASYTRILSVIESPVTISDEHATHPEKHIEKGDITFNHVSFKYFKDNHQYVLKDINLSISGGEMIGIIGTTGSGKTTLISLLSRLYDPDLGSITIDGVDLRDYSFKNLRADVGVVLQKNQLFSGTVADNLRWGKEDATLEEMVHACTIAQADEFITQMDQGYDSYLGQGGTGLSGGQQQRLCIARALMRKPRIMILDDATSAVDAATDASIRHAFKEELKAMTKLIIAQRITSIIEADRIIVMDDGMIAGFGTHQTLMRDCQVYRDIYYSQKEKEGDVNE